jgi:hypothetical protein
LSNNNTKLTPYGTLYYVDSAGSLAVPTTNYVLKNNLLVPTPVDANGNPLVTVASRSTTDITFHDAAVAPVDGAVFDVGGNKTLTIEISGTSTSRTIAFIGRGPSGEDRYIAGVKLSDLSVATGSTGAGELWQFDITGLTSVLMKVPAVAGGNVTVKGRAVA